MAEPGEGGSVPVLRVRTKQYALRVIRLYAALGKDAVSQVCGRQLLRSATSVGAHHREAARSRTPAEFVSKMEVGLQELDEPAYWLELLADGKIFPVERLADLLDETKQLTRMFAASILTAKKKRDRKEP